MAKHLKAEVAELHLVGLGDAVEEGLEVIGRAAGDSVTPTGLML